MSINTAAVRDPSIVARLAESFGSQCVVAAVDVTRRDGRLTVMVNGGREATPLEAIDWIRQLEGLGAGRSSSRRWIATAPARATTSR